MRCFFFFQAEDGIRDLTVTGVQTCALPIYGATLVRIPVGGLGGVDQSVRDLPSHHRVRPDGAVEVGDRAVREELRIGGYLERARGNGARALDFEGVIEQVAPGRPSEEPECQDRGISHRSLL